MYLKMILKVKPLIFVIDKTNQVTTKKKELKIFIYNLITVNKKRVNKIQITINTFKT